MPGPLESLKITAEEFSQIRSLVYDRFGINLTEQKQSLVVGRLQKLLKSLGYNSFAEYLKYLKADASGQSLIDLVNRISTNHSFFFRGGQHFEYLKATALPEIVQRLEAEHSRDLRIWSAGCATGEEPYTITILLQEFFGAQYKLWEAGMLATDISARALEFAKRGIYPSNRVSETPPALLKKYFRPVGEEEYAVSEQVKQHVTFRRFNLMNTSFPFKRPFHMIFCRNVMIYFDQPTRDALVQRFANATVPGGYLFIGHSESLLHGGGPYKYVLPALYRKEGG